MTWPVVAVVLAAALAFGVLAGRVRSWTGTLALVALVAVIGLAVFMPNLCAQGIADTATGDGTGSTSCDTLYGAALPEMGTLQEDTTGWLLACAPGVLALLGAVVSRRTRRRVRT